MVVLSDGRHSYIHMFESNASMLSQVFFFTFSLACYGQIDGRTDGLIVIQVASEKLFPENRLI